MKMKARGGLRGLAVHRIAAAVALAMLPAAGQAQDKWGAHIDLEAKPGSRRSLGEADLFVPLLQDARMLVFGNLRLRMDDHSGREGNLGLGVRQMTDSDFNLGGYVYLDRRRSEMGNRFNQVTLGAEALGRDWDLRGNVYLPTGSRVRDLGLTGTSTAAQAGNTVVVTTLAREERALKGFDVEVGYRVPLWAADADRQLRVYAGGYRFSDSVARVAGPRVRAELALYDLPVLGHGAQLLLGAEFQKDSARRDHGFVSVRLRVPLGGKEAARSAITFQERRMTAPVVRDVDIVTRTVDAPWRPALMESASTTADGRTLVLLDSGTTTGAALPGAVAAAGADSTVVLSGTYNTTANTALQPGQTLMGAGSVAVRTPSGRTAVFQAPGAAIHGNIGGTVATVNMAPGSTLTGMTVTHFNTSNAAAIAVRASAVNDVVISNNTIAGSSGAGALTVNGVLIQNGAKNVVVRNNTITVTTASNVQNLVGINASPGLGGSVIATGNTISLSGTTNFAAAIGAAGGVPGGTTLTASGNTLNAAATSANNFAVHVINSTIAAGSTGNIRLSGGCSYQVGSSGTLGFADGTSCP